MDITLPHYIVEVLGTLRAHRYEAFCVGGCVRDTLLGISPHDWDVCTNATPAQTKVCFSDYRLVLSGERHGTVGVIACGGLAEITTYRVDGAYTDHRRPDSVRYGDSLPEDLARRDFTINAMAYAPESGLIDPHGGQADLAAGIIRCVGDPNRRFAEDALRMLRALRFASRFGFTIEPETAGALVSRRMELGFIAPERILAELSDTDFAKVSPRFLPVLQAVIPELTALRVPAGLPRQPVLQLAALLRGLDAAPILVRLKASNALRDRVAVLASEPEPLSADDISMRRLLRRIGPEAARQLLTLTGNCAAWQALGTVLARGDCYTLSALRIGGDALLSLGFEGKAVGSALNALLDQVVDGTLPNDPNALLKAASALRRTPFPPGIF